MSKRNGDVQVVDYIVGLHHKIFFDTLSHVFILKRRGWEPEAILNWLALAGWGARHEATPSTPPPPPSAPPPSTHVSRPRLLQEAPDSTTIMNFPELLDQVRRPVYVVGVAMS
jgi:glutamyl-tRNA synthetase